jgi:uncharacterized repeat protein (TIGR03806 family)
MIVEHLPIDRQRRIKKPVYPNMRSPSPLFRLSVGLLLGAGLLGIIACQRHEAAANHPRATLSPVALSPAKRLPTPLPATRMATAPFLNLPSYAYESLPFLLSQTGAFTDLATLTPHPSLLPYVVNAPLWTDGALKKRWIMVPHQPDLPANERPAISFAPTGEWYFPSGTVLVKQFDLATDERDGSKIRRLETRFIVRSHDGQVYGATYRWREDQTDAELLNDGRDDDITITNRDGSSHVQHWHYPSRFECLSCHNRVAGGILGVSTRQINADIIDQHGKRVNQLQRWNELGLLQPAIRPEEFASLPRLVDPHDAQANITDRVRSYLDSNCSHCHRPGAMGFVSYDARFETPIERQNILYARPVNDYGIDRVRYIKPNDPWRSMLLVRLERSDTMKMPPLGRNVLDHHAIDLMREWITSMDAPPALPPPTITVEGNRNTGPLTISASHSDPLATLYYTLDGSLPDDESLVYQQPLTVSAPAIVRIKAIRNGYASSIALLTELHKP